MATLNPTGSFNVKRPGFIQISNTDKAVTFGTYMFNSTFGEVAKMDLGREAEEILITGGWGQLIAFILKNFHYTLSMEIIIMGDDPIPGPGDEIEFPLVDVKGRVKGNVKRMADDSSAHKYSLEAWSWDALDNNGAGTAIVVDPSLAPGQTVAPYNYQIPNNTPSDN